MVSQTTNLVINHVEESQNQKEVTMNTAIDVLEGAVCGFTTIDLEGLSGDYTPTAETMRQNLLIKITGALSGAVNLIVPSTYKKPYWIVHNGTLNTVTVKTSGGTGPSISAGETQLTYCDGTNVIAISSAGAGGSTQPTAPNTVFLDGLGGLDDLPIGANVDPNLSKVYVEGAKMKQSIEFNFTESSPGSGNYDQITPLFLDAIPVGVNNVEVEYYV